MQDLLDVGLAQRDKLLVGLAGRSQQSDIIAYLAEYCLFHHRALQGAHDIINDLVHKHASQLTKRNRSSAASGSLSVNTRAAWALAFRSQRLMATVVLTDDIKVAAGKSNFHPYLVVAVNVNPPGSFVTPK